MKRSRDRASPSPEGLAAADAAASASTSAGHTSRSSTLADPGSEEGAAAAVVASATRSARTSSATLSVPIHMRVFQNTFLEYEVFAPDEESEEGGWGYCLGGAWGHLKVAFFKSLPLVGAGGGRLVSFS